MPAPCTPQGVRTSGDTVHGSLELTGFPDFGASSPRAEANWNVERLPCDSYVPQKTSPTQTLGNQVKRRGSNHSGVRPDLGPFLRASGFRFHTMGSSGDSRSQ